MAIIVTDKFLNDYYNDQDTCINWADIGNMLIRFYASTNKENPVSISSFSEKKFTIDDLNLMLNMNLVGVKDGHILKLKNDLIEVV